MNHRLRALALCLTVSAAPVIAQEAVLEPGLWEINARNMQVDGQRLPEVHEMLAAMPPEQRRMMTEMLKQRGVEMAGQGFHVCLTPEQVRAGELPMHDPESGCRQEITERSGSTWKFRFSCPHADGQGVATFANKRSFSARMDSTFKNQSMAQAGSMETHGRWLKADCGAVSPVR